MARARDHRKHIACLESLWNSDIENRLSVVPILELVSRINRTRYTYLTCNTREELAYNLGKLGARRGYRILYLSLHGKPGELVLDGARTDLETLAGMLGTRFSGWVVHFGSCSTINVPRARIGRFMAATKVATVLGYSTDVNWIASAALDLLLFDWFQYYDDTRRLWRDFRRQYAGLIRQTGLVAFHG
ncbi:MAG: hypothetical protein IT529_09090 [Burkholderiales bacterium]|nr:hypothetical protein [Burkholderiales bacterium]